MTGLDMKNSANLERIARALERIAKVMEDAAKDAADAKETEKEVRW